MVDMPENPNFKEAIEDLVLKMPIANFIGMRFIKIELGFVEIVIPYREELSFSKGVFQAGPVGMLMDIAACCAIGTKLPSGWAFSTIDFTTKIVAPATGESFIARGHAVSSGKSVSVGKAEVFAINNGIQKLSATGLVTTRNFEIRN